MPEISRRTLSSLKLGNDQRIRMRILNVPEGKKYQEEATLGTYIGWE